MDSNKETEVKEETNLEQNSEEKKMSIEHPDFMKPYRLEGETDNQYKARKIVQKLYIKQKKKGTLAWIAKDTRLPIMGEKDTAQENKVIGYKVSEGFTYNKEKFNKAIEAWKIRQKELEQKQQIKETENK